MRKQLTFIGVFGAFVLFVLPAAASAATVNVTMHDDYFSPQAITVNAGDTVVWTNEGTTDHTVNADNGLFNSGLIAPGGSFSETLSAGGTYAYHDQSYGAAGGAGMAGTIIVQTASTIASSASSAASGQAAVTLSAGAITPGYLTINPGTTVVWTNTSGSTQSVVADNGVFQSGPIAPGGQFAATFNASGTYNYYDNANGSAIVGEIIVTGASVSTPPQSTYVNVNPSTGYYPSTGSTYSTTPSSNSTLAALEAQLQSLLSEINALEGNSGSVSTNVSGAPAYNVSGSCPQIGRVLSLGSSGSDVTSLQQFLATNVGYSGGASGYFGAQTQTAVEQYQSQNNIISYGTPDTTGYGVVGPRTAAAIRLACSGGSITTVTATPGTGGGIVSGFLQVSPVTGSAPLTTTVTATVNTAASCTGATYTVDFGDGSQDQVIPVAAGNCSQQNQSFQHTYQYGGSYTVTLSSGAHSSTAVVTVSGPAAPSTAVTGQSNPSQASGSMTAFISSGNAPLATTFYISCSSGLAYDVTFGDGTDLGSNGVSQSSCNGGLQSVAHTYTSPGSYNAQLIVFVRSSNGAVSSQSVAEQGITVNGTSSSAATSSTPSSTSFAKPSLTPNVGGNPLAVTLQFNALACGSSYSLNWGDASSVGTASMTTIDCAAGTASGTVQTFTASHTYAAAGAYNVTLTRATSTGSTQSDTVGVTIAD